MARIATVASLDAARQRRHYIELAHATSAWLELAASWALEGIVMTDDDAERAGRMIAGHASCEQVVQDIRARQQR